MRRKIPPIHLLESFEATVRLGNLTRAAQELHVTQGAVSQHIRKLEQFLEQPLFRRQGQRLLASEITKTYYHKIRAILNSAEEATSSLVTHDNPSGQLTLSAPTTFSACWLMPRLAQFSAQHPGIQVHLLNRDPELTQDNDLIDLVMEYKPAGDDSASSSTVFRETIVPVCSPGYLNEREAPTKPEDLLTWKLIHQTHSPGGASDTWLRMNGVDDPTKMAGFRFDRQVFAISAAEDGLGLTFVPEIFVRNQLATGTLVMPIDRPVDSLVALKLTLPSYKFPTSRSEAFKQWLMEETAAERG